MKTTEMIEKFERALSGGGYLTSDFVGLCRRIGVSPGKMNRVLEDTVGFSGEEIVKSYKFDLPYLLL